MQRAEELRRRNLYGELLSLRDEQRRRAEDALRVVPGDELPWELNPQGKMRWYLHPTIEDVALNTLLFFVQEIPPASRTGRQRTQGGQVLYVWKGRGYTEVDGAEHHWEAGDVINLPLVTEGIVVQHFNLDPKIPATLLHAEPNLTSMIGVDMGSGFDQLESAPEYETVR